MKTKFNFSNYGNDLSLTTKDVEKCSHSGDCEADVIEVSKKEYVKKQTSQFDKEQLKKELSDYGAWDETELQDHEQNIIRWIWLSACDIKENN